MAISTIYNRILSRFRCLDLAKFLCFVALCSGQSYKFHTLPSRGVEDSCKVGAEFESSVLECARACSDDPACSQLLHTSHCQLLKCSTPDGGHEVNVKVALSVGNRYQVICKDVGSFSVAAEVCSDLGGKLAEPDTPAEILAWKELDLPQCGEGWLFTGLRLPWNNNTMTQQSTGQAVTHNASSLLSPGYSFGMDSGVTTYIMVQTTDAMIDDEKAQFPGKGALCQFP